VSTHCEGCGEVLTGRRRRYCSPRCKLRVWWRNHRRDGHVRCSVCSTCQQSFFSVYRKKYCSKECQARQRKPKQTVTLTCVQCGAAFIRTKGTHQATCSLVCRSARLSTQLLGKKYRLQAYSHTCVSCGKTFTNSRLQQVTCARCLLRVWRRGKGKYRERCKRARVPYVAGVTPAKVFARDGWRCQLCGCATPKRLRGTYKPNAPELDHIIPINAKGGSPGHVWENVQCACRSCNHKKRDKPLGQLRLAV
jgi:hypothetical protein